MMVLLVRIIIALNIILVFMLSPCVSHPIWVQQPHDEQDHEGLNKHSFPAFARKLKHHDDEANVKTVGNKHYIPYNMQEEALPDKLHHKEAKMVHARKGTRQEWMEGADTSQFFTMDYVPVRRRRPINNKFVPVAP